jgi:hypothetical protein
MVDVKLLVPETIYAVPGIEMNVYFQNIVTVINPRNYAFEVHCEKGHADEKRWHYTPSDGEEGEYKWSIRIHCDEGVAAEAVSHLIVSPRTAGMGKDISLLMVGASDLGSPVGPPLQIHRLMSGPFNPRFTMIGSTTCGYGSPSPGGVAHEGWGGWDWLGFCTAFGKPETYKGDGLHPDRAVAVNSRFLIEKDGRPVFDFQQYLDKYNHGAAPDFICIGLGINCIIGGTDENMEELMQNYIFPYQEQMIRAFRSAAPDTVIGVGIMCPPAGQDAFGTNYGCNFNWWQMRKNHDRYARALILRSAKDMLDYQLIPRYINLDTENNYPVATEPINADNPQTIIRQCNAYHPARAGYAQIGDVIYSWLKYNLASQDKK